MVCGSGTFTERLLDFRFIKAVTCQYADVMGLLVLGLVVYGFISMSIYVRTGSVVIPFVLLLLTGGAVMTQVAGVATAFATVLVLVTGAGTITLLYYRYSR